MTLFVVTTFLVFLGAGGPLRSGLFCWPLSPAYTVIYREQFIVGGTCCSAGSNHQGARSHVGLVSFLAGWIIDIEQQLMFLQMLALTC